MSPFQKSDMSTRWWCGSVWRPTSLTCAAYWTRQTWQDVTWRCRSRVWRKSCAVWRKTTRRCVVVFWNIIYVELILHFGVLYYIILYCGITGAGCTEVTADRHSEHRGWRCSSARPEQGSGWDSFSLWEHHTETPQGTGGLVQRPGKTSSFSLSIWILH